MVENIWNKNPAPQNHLGSVLGVVLMLAGTGAVGAYVAYEEHPLPPAPPKLELSEAVAAFDAGRLAPSADAFRQLAAQGDARAEYWYGHALDQGLGVKRDARQALVEFTKAWAGGVAKAGQRLGEIYRDGDQVVQDLPKAREYFRGAATRGDAQAAAEFGQMLRTGLGGPVDPVAAYAWLEIASMHGNLAAQQERDALLAHLTPEQQEAGDVQAAALQLQITGKKQK